jgi:YidC/Oxa1 family membrane protein insertase
MEKRVLLAIVLCVGVMVGWWLLFPPKQQETPPQAPPAKTETASPSASPAGTPTGAAPSAPGTAAAGAPTANQPAKTVELLTPDVKFVLSNRGGTLVHAELLGAQFRDPHGMGGHDVVRVHELSGPNGQMLGELATTFPSSQFATPPDTAWELSQPDAQTVVFTAETDTVHIEKRFRADTTPYRLHLDVVVRNKSAKNVDHHLALHINGWQDPEKKGGGFFSAGTANPASMICRMIDDKERRPIEKLAKDPIDKTGGVYWIAADEKFFLLAAVPYPETPSQQRTCRASSANGEFAEGSVTFAARTLPPQGSTVYSFAVFSGPKIITDLENVRPGGQEVHLDDAVDVSLAWLSRPILGLLKFFHRFAHNWGVAIILLTLFIKLITFYPTQRSLLSAKKMQKLAPKMAAIRKKYENDRQRQSVETMNLYKAHGVSPLGGCLPSLIQMPIWIALYSTLNYAVELYRAPFFAHIHDLTAPDPWKITPLVMGAVMFLQMKMSPASPDKQQQAIMAVMMPAMFTLFSLFLPAGLALYMLTSYLIGILQQLYVNHVDRKATA